MISDLSQISHLLYIVVQATNLWTLSRADYVPARRPGVGANHYALVEVQTHHGGATVKRQRRMEACLHQLRVAAEDLLGIKLNRLLCKCLLPQVVLIVEASIAVPYVERIDVGDHRVCRVSTKYIEVKTVVCAM